MTGEEYIERADDSLEETYEPPMSLSAYVEQLFENPGSAAHASKYLLSAIEAAGTRTVLDGVQQVLRGVGRRRRVLHDGLDVLGQRHRRLVGLLEGVVGAVDVLLAGHSSISAFATSAPANSSTSFAPSVL